MFRGNNSILLTMSFPRHFLFCFFRCFCFNPNYHKFVVAPFSASSGSAPPFFFPISFQLLFFFLVAIVKYAKNAGKNTTRKAAKHEKRAEIYSQASKTNNLKIRHTRHKLNGPWGVKRIKYTL